MRWIDALAIVPFLCATMTAVAQTRMEFPSAKPEDVGASDAALTALDEIARGYVERDETVGAELLVIKNRRTVLHSAYGWFDREKKKKLEPGAICCIRSMSKSFVGTAVQMLIDEGRLGLDDPVSKRLPAFDTDSHRSITTRMLLEHRSGLPLSSLIAVDLHTIMSVQDVAAMAAKAELHFAPDSNFSYSDDGTDTLAALVEKVTGAPVEKFIQERILDPLGMRDTIPVLREKDPRIDRVASAYMGTTGAWSRFWSAGDPPVFPCFLGSQSMYSTCEDYARFLALWADDGKFGDRRLLSHDAVQRALMPRSPMGYPAPREGLAIWYGQLWMVLGVEKDGESKLQAFGHGGSDGTMAWMWPDQDLIVVYFTQARGGMTPISLDKEIDRLLIRGDLTVAAASPARDLSGFAGVYWNDEQKYYWAITPQTDKLRAELQGRTVLDLVPGASDGDWNSDLGPPVTVHFDINAAGVAQAIEVTLPGGDVRRMARLPEKNDLPSADDVMAKVRSAHRLDQIEGVIRREGVIEARGQTGRIAQLLARTGTRIDMDLAGTKTRSVVLNGHAWLKRGDGEAEERRGDPLVQSIMESPQFIFGDWKQADCSIRVLKRVEEAGKPALLVRAAPPNGWGCAFYVDDETSRVVCQNRVALIPGLGPTGVEACFDDFSEVGAAVLARRSRTEFAIPALGTIEFRAEQATVDKSLDEKALRIDAP